jgi:hypothetical protein
LNGDPRWRGAGAVPPPQWWCLERAAGRRGWAASAAAPAD